MDYHRYIKTNSAFVGQEIESNIKMLVNADNTRKYHKKKAIWIVRQYLSLVLGYIKHLDIVRCLKYRTMTYMTYKVVDSIDSILLSSVINLALKMEILQFVSTSTDDNSQVFDIGIEIEILVLPGSIWHEVISVGMIAGQCD